MSTLPSVDEILALDKKLCAPKPKDTRLFLTAHMVDIFVGTEKKKFHLHRDLLCERSDYFKASFAGKFKAAQDNEHFLPEDDIESFGLFIEWLYGGHLKKISSNDDMPKYLGLIVLSDKLCLEHLRNKTMDRILGFHRTNPVLIDFQSLRYIFQNTVDDDASRIYLFDVAIATSTRADGLSADGIEMIREGGELAVYYTNCLTRIYHVLVTCSPDYQQLRNVIYDPRKKSNCHWHKHNSTPVCTNSAK